MNILRDYQKEGYDDILATQEQEDGPIMFVLATGGGKTVTFVELVKYYRQQDLRVMLIAHRTELIQQMFTTLYNNGIYAGIIKSKVKPNYNLPVQVGSIQTIERRHDLPPADVVIFDEGHHVTVNNTYGATIKRYPNAKILLFTATPYRLSGEGFRYIHPYKPTTLIINRTYRQLVDEGWLVPLEYCVAGTPDLGRIKLNKGDYSEEESAKAMELVPLVDSYKEHANGKKGVVFCVNVAHSIQVCAQYKAEGIAAEHLDATTPDQIRAAILGRFREGTTRIICNVGIITEGIDFPDCEFIQLARPSKSLSLYLQMVGRVSRPAIPVDLYLTPEERREAIRISMKPTGLVLDNAGLWQDHPQLPDGEQHWEKHFQGRKKSKELTDETMEILVYVCEDKNGNEIKTTNAKEIEGLRLIKITAEMRTKLISLKCLDKFDFLFRTYRRMDVIKNPGYLATRNFIKYCQDKRFLMTDEVWAHVGKTLIRDIDVKLQDFEEKFKMIKNDQVAENLYGLEIGKLRRERVSREWLKSEYHKYQRENKLELDAHRITIAQ